MKKTICLILLAVSLVLGCAGCKSDALPGDNSTTGVIGESTQTTDKDTTAKNETTSKTKTSKTTAQSKTETGKKDTDMKNETSGDTSRENSGSTGSALQKDPKTADPIIQVPDKSNGKVKTYSQDYNENANGNGKNASK